MYKFPSIFIEIHVWFTLYTIVNKWDTYDILSILATFLEPGTVMAVMARIRATMTKLKRVASVVVDPKAILMYWYKKIRHKPRPPPSGSDSNSRLKATSDDDHDLVDRRKKLIISMMVIAFAFGLYVCMISDRH